MIKVNGVDLAAYATFARVLDRGGSGHRGSNVVIPGRDGEHSDFSKPFDSSDLLLEVGLLGDNAYTNLTAVHRLVGASQVILEDVTVNGTLEAVVEMLGKPVQTQDRFTWGFPFRVPSGSWRTKTVSTATGNPPSVTTSGDRPIPDPVVTFSGPGTATLTDVDGIVYGLTIDAGAGAGVYVVDCGARTVKKSGVAQDRYLTMAGRGWWRLSPGVAASIVSTVSITVDWRNRWASG